MKFTTQDKQQIMILINTEIQSLLKKKKAVKTKSKKIEIRYKLWELCELRNKL